MLSHLRSPRTNPRLAIAAIATIALAPSLAAAPPTTDELIDNATKAMGGKAIKKIESYMSSAELTSPMGNMTSEVYWAKPKHVLVKRLIPQMGEMEAATNGTIGWQKVPMMGGYTLVEGAQMEEIVQQAMHIRLLQVRELLNDGEFELNSVTEGVFDGVPCYGLAFAGKEPNAPSGTMHFDAKTSLIRGMDMSEAGQAVTLTLKDWKRIDDVSFFHRVDMTNGQMDMSMKFTKIELNKVDPTLFEVPAEVKAMATSRPAKSDKTARLKDFSAPVQKMINEMIDGLPWDDVSALGAAKTGLESQAGQIPGEYGKAMKYLLEKIEARITELGG